MQKFLTAYGDRKKGIVPSGTKTEPKYEYVTDETGDTHLEVIGEENIYEQIQSYCEESKLENILARCIAGDKSVLRPDGIYADITDLPKNMIEAQQAMQKLRNTWSELTPEMRSKYNNNVGEFIAKSGTIEWQQDMGLLPIKMETEPTPKVTETATIQTHGEVKENE